MRGTIAAGEVGLFFVFLVLCFHLFAMGVSTLCQLFFICSKKIGDHLVLKFHPKLLVLVFSALL